MGIAILFKNMIFKSILLACALVTVESRNNNGGKSGGNRSTGRGNRPRESVKKVAGGIRSNSFDLMADLVEFDQNIVISPLSIMGAMFMLAAGTAGESRKEILDALGFDDATKSNETLQVPFEAYSKMIQSLSSQPVHGYTLNVANGIFHQSNMSTYSPNSLQPEYIDLLKQ